MNTDLHRQLKAVVRGLLKAYAMGEARGGVVDQEVLDRLVEDASRALPGEYEKALAYAREEQTA